MIPASRSDWWRATLLGTARFVIAVIIYGGALMLSRSWSSGLDRMPVWFVLVASAVLAAVLWMTRKPLQDLVDRLVLGDRADGYAQVRVLLQRMATTLPVDEVVPALAGTAGRTVHSSRAEVRLNMSDGMSTYEPADLPADLDQCGAEGFLRKQDIDAAALLA